MSAAGKVTSATNCSIQMRVSNRIVGQFCESVKMAEVLNGARIVRDVEISLAL